MAVLVVTLVLSSSTILVRQTTLASDQRTQEEMNERLVLDSIDEVYNNHSLSAMEKYYAMNFTSGFTGLEDFNATKRFLEQSIAGMPDMTAKAILNMSKGDRVLAFIFWNGTWTDDAFGMAPTGQVYNATTAEVYRISDGKIVEQWQVSDVRNWPFRGSMNVEAS